jgi:hypothetical protein
MLATANILAEDFSGLGMFLVIMLLGLPALSLLSFISSYRGRFPFLAIPPMLLSLALIFSLVIANEAIAYGFAAMFGAPLVLGASSIGVWIQRRRDRSEK